MTKHTEPHEFKSFIATLQFLIEKTDFLKFRKLLYHQIYCKLKPREMSPEQMRKIVSDDVTSDFTLGKSEYDEILKNFVFSDLVGFGPVDFLFQYTNWTVATYLVEKGELVISNIEYEEETINIECFRFPFYGIDQNIVKTNYRLDPMMPVVCMSVDEYFFSIVLKPVSPDGWLRIYNKPELKKNWTNWNL